MLLRVQKSMFWPNISKQIEEYVHLCAPCQTISKSHQKEPAIPIEVPSSPWKVLEMDFFMHKNKWFLIVTDYYSRYPYILKKSSIASKDVISALRLCFSVLGTPEENHLQQCKICYQQRVQGVCCKLGIFTNYKQFLLHKRSQLH